jgi:cytochrome c biogenesis protein CcmG/thiol:disulfide interchange protein DsbE
MKNWFKKKSNIFTLFLLAFLVWTKGPEILKNFNSEGLKLKSQEYQVLNSPDSELKVQFPVEKSKSIAIFWATWCGPCKLEMNRLKTSVEEGRIPKEKIFAINPFESNEVIRNFLGDNSYPFTFIDAHNIAYQLQVDVTPTTLFIEDEIVTSRSSGLSFIGIWKAEYFL